MSYQAGTAGSVVIVPQSGQTVTVTITTVAGATPTVYSDTARTVTVSMPDTISATTYFYLANDDYYVVSVKEGGQEVATLAGVAALAALTGERSFVMTPSRASQIAQSVESVNTRAGAVVLTATDTALAVTAKTSSFTAAAGKFYSIDTTAGAVTATLPTGAAGDTIGFKLTAPSPVVNAVTLTAAGSDHFNTSTGSTSLTLSLLNQAMTIESNGAGVWSVISDDITLGANDARYVSKDTIFVNALDHGIVGDGATDDQAAINTLIAASTGKRLVFPAGKNFLIKGPIHVNVSSIVLDFTLATVTTDATMTTSSSNAVTINSSPTFGTSYGLVANAQEGDTAVSVSPANSTHFAVGDYVLVRSNALLDTDKHVGELQIVRSVDTTNGQIYLQDRVFETGGYQLGDSPSIVKVPVLTDVTIRGGKFTTNVTGTPDIATAVLWARFCDRLEVSGTSFVENYYTAVDFTSCLNSTFDRNNIDHVKTTTASATIRYGIWVASACRGITVSGNHFNRCRHSVTVGTHSGTNFEGRIRDLNVIGNTSVASDTAHFDCHQPLDGGLFVGNTCIGGLSYLDPAAANVHGIQVRGKTITISGNKISDMYGAGVAVMGDTLHTAQAITISGNIINECNAPRVMTYLTSGVTLSASFTATVNDASALAASGTIRLNATDTFTYTSITGSTLNGCVSSQTTAWVAESSCIQAGTGGVGIDIDSAATISGLVITGNVIQGTDSSAVKGEGSQTGVLVESNYCKANGRLSTVASIQFGSAAGPIRVIGNTIEGNVLSRPISITSSDGHDVSGNSFVGNFNQVPSVAGTNSQVFNNRGLNPIAPYAIGSITGTATVTRVNGNVQSATLTGNTTVTLTSGLFIGDELTLVLTQDGTGSRVITWAGTLAWRGTTPLVLTTTAAAVDRVRFVWDGVAWSEVYRNTPAGGAPGSFATVNNLSEGVAATMRTNLGLGSSATTAVSTATPLADSATAPSAGATNTSMEGHTHPRVSWAPVDHNYKSWTFDPAIGSTTSVALATAGRAYCIRLHAPVAFSATNLVVYVKTVGATLTTGQCFGALAQSGSFLGFTADQSTNWTSTGELSMPLVGGPFNVAAGDFYALFWFNGTTGPALMVGNSVSSVNSGLSVANSRFGYANTGLTTTSGVTTMPAVAAAINASYWVGVS